MKIRHLYLQTNNSGRAYIDTGGRAPIAPLPIYAYGNKTET